MIIMLDMWQRDWFNMKLEIKEYSNLERKIAIILNFTLLALSVVASIVYKILMGLSNDNYKIFG
jgi:hypothetical protein